MGRNRRDRAFANDDTLARQMQAQSSQMAMDEALAMALQYDESNFTIDDAAIARQIQQEEDTRMINSLSEDEELARQLQAMEGVPKNSLSDDEKLARWLQEQETQHAMNHGASTSEYDDVANKFQDLKVGRATSQRDVPSTSYGQRDRHHGDSSSDSSSSGECDHHHVNHNHDHSSSDGSSCDHNHDHSSSSDRFQSLPSDEDIDPDNMTYEEINELEESIGEVSKGLSKKKISRLPTHKYSTKTSWRKLRKPKNKDSQCSICQTGYQKGDRLMTLPCGHQYHQECISRWLQQNKVCCICKKEVSP